MADRNKKRKSGLHKEISSIFDGVPVPNDRTTAKPHAGPERGQAGYDSPQPPAKPPQNPQIPNSQRFKRPGAGQANAGEATSAVGRGTLKRIAAKLFAPRPGVSPARQKAMVLLVPTLLVVLGIMLIKTFGVPSLKTKKPVIPEPTTAIGAISTKITWQKPEPYPVGLRDPMQLTDEMKTQINVEAQDRADALTRKQTNATDPQATKAGELTVKGILFSDDNPSAVVGTRIAHVGDIIVGATIVKITRKSVEFEKDGERWTQTLEP